VDHDCTFDKTHTAVMMNLISASHSLLCCNWYYLHKSTSSYCTSTSVPKCHEHGELCTSHWKLLHVFSLRVELVFIGNSIYNYRDVKKHLDRIKYWLDLWHASRGGWGAHIKIYYHDKIFSELLHFSPQTDCMYLQQGWSYTFFISCVHLGHL
jgi:hypothetical protein